MPDLLPIQELTPFDVRTLLLAAAIQPRPIEDVAQFVASVDWSTADGPIDDEVAAMLGEAEGLVTDAAEGAITFDTFITTLINLASTVHVPPMPSVVEPAALTVRIDNGPLVRTERFLIVGSAAPARA